MKKFLRIGALVFLFIFSTSLAMADFVNVPASAFRGDTETTAFDTDGNYTLKTTGSGFLYAPVNLPNGVVIKNMRLLYMDNSASFDVTARILRCNMFNGTWTELFTVTTSGASAAAQSLVDSTTPVPANRMVYNNVLQYCVQLNFTGGDSLIRIYGVTIEY